MKNKSLDRQISLTLFVVFGFAVSILGQSGGTFEFRKSVIAGGGGQSAGGTFTLDGTIGQSIAGITSFGGVFDVTGGFWGGGAAPPVSNVTVSGQVSTPGGLGLRNAVVSLTDPAGVRRTVLSSTLGFYTFTAVETGHTYTISVSSRRYRFVSRNVDVGSDLSNINFTGLE